ncbi:MAG: exodeoxyribonuclease VII small subunit [Anaerovoracaceae bacterium]|jgi:exodeoxyribonuclease VII small subunit
MADKEEKMDFETAYKKLSECAESLSSPEVSLSDAVEQYKKGLEYYKICKGILDEAKQLIQVYDKETDSVKEI